MSTPTRSLTDAFSALKFLATRTPESTAEDRAGAFARLTDYRDGGIFIGHYAGNSEWERHSRGEEIVFVAEGATTLYLLRDGNEEAVSLGAGELCVVPQNTWHRFETPDHVKVMTVTPHPTDHSITRPSD